MAGPGLILGVDGGNTKTVALVVDADGNVVGAARGGCSDCYALPSLDAAVREIRGICAAALAAAGAAPRQVDAAAYSLAGADWPEDIEDLASRLSTTIACRRPPSVCNDAIGALWAAFGGGDGAVAACGTHVAVAARGRAGEWHASFWAEPAGAVHLGQAALDAVYRAELGTGPETSLSRTIPAVLDLPDVSAVLHRFTNRGRGDHDAVARLASSVLDSAQEGDAVAQQLIEGEAHAITTTVAAAARRTALQEPYPLALLGGVLSHPSTGLAAAVAALAGDRCEVQVPRRQPAAGAVLLAAHHAGLHVDRDAVHESILELGAIPDWRAGTHAAPGASGR